MEGNIVFSVLNAKYIHASPAPWCLAAGVKAYAPELYSRVRIIEATVNQQQDDILQRILAEVPAVVGFSCYLWNIDMTLTLCKLLKETLPNTIILLGGPEVSYCASDILQKNQQVDFILSGEGEESVPALLKVLLAPMDTVNRYPSNCQDLAGLCGREQDGTIFKSDPCVLKGAVPSSMSAGYAKAVQGRISYFDTSRGCPYSCAFCLSGRCGTPRYFALEDVLQDLLILANSGTRTIKFVDRTFNAKPSHANQILSFILKHYGSKIPEGICFHFEIAGDILKEETFYLLSQMPIGAVQLEIGMQSFCEQTLDAVHRKTNTAILRSNIERLVAMGNMHIHIDLISGLPYESLSIFAESFNTGYALGAQMVQLGFLKLLHGSTMRSQPQNFPCEFSETPPYEVVTTPWLSSQDFELLHYTEDAVERIYNSGRFRLTAEYILDVSKKTPFEFYTELGIAAHKSGIRLRVTLDDYTAFLQEYCASLPGVDKELLRDVLVQDRLSTNSLGRLPPCLYRPDAKLSKAIKKLAACPETAPKKGVRRGVALLYAAKTVCWVDYVPLEQNPVTGRWSMNQLPWNVLLS